MTSRRQHRQAKHQAARQQNIRSKSQQWHLQMQTAITRFQSAQKARLDRWKNLFPTFLPLNLSRLPSYLQTLVAVVGKFITRGQTIRNKIVASADALAAQAGAIGDQLAAASRVGTTRKSIRRARQLRAGHVNFGLWRSKKAKPSNRAKVTSLRAGFESLEARQMLAADLYVNDNWVETANFGGGAPDGVLQAGDTVANSGAGDNGLVTGKTFGTNAFSTITAALEGVC